MTRPFPALLRSSAPWILLTLPALWAHAGEEPPPPAAVTAGDAAAPAVAEAEGDTVGSLLRLAASFVERTDYAAGEIAYRQVLAHPQSTPAEQSDALIGLAHMYRLQHAPTKAAAVYEKFLQVYNEDPRTPEVLLDLGRTLRSMGAHRLAIARFYSVINSTLKISRTEPDHYQMLARTAQFEIAETHFAVGNYREAGKFFARLGLLELAPADQARAQFMAARAQQLGGENEKAVLALQTFLGRWPASEHAAEAAYLLATTLRQLERIDEALTVTHRLLSTVQAGAQQDPRRWAYWQRRTGNQLANDFFQSGHLMSALGLYQRLAGLSSDPAWRLPVTYQIALCHEKLHDPSQAESTYRAIVDDTAALGADAPEELREFARMATWRLDNLAWHGRTSQQLNEFFPAPPAHVSLGSPPTASDPL